MKSAQTELVTKADLEQAFAQLRKDLTIRMVLVMGVATAVQIGALFAMLKALIPGA